jgi:Protein phosphatase 2C
MGRTREGHDVVWETATASTIGPAHLATGRPNQDAAAGCTTGRGATVAVADGHGGPAYVRSGLGSAFAVAAALAVVDGIDTDRWSPRTARRALVRDVVPRIIERWHAAVSAHLAAHPFTAQEQAAVLHPTTAYGTTLLMAIATPQVVAVVQIGDGDVLVVDPTGHTSRLFAGAVSDGDLTASMAALDPGLARIAVRPAAGTSTVLCATDGYGGSFDSTDWWHEVGADLHDLFRDHGFGPVRDSLRGWTDASAGASGDDTTVGVLHRTSPEGSLQEP